MEELFESEHTEVLARIAWSRQRPSFVWLMVATIALCGAVAITLLAPPSTETVDKKTVKAIETIAIDIGKTIDASATSAHATADRLAGAPAMRAAILTDAATMADVLKDEMKVALAVGQTLEVFQVHDGKTLSLIRMPANAAALPTIRDRQVGMVHLDGGVVQVVVGAPIEELKGEGIGDRTGEVVFSVPVDLDATRAALAQHAKSAQLEADGHSQSLMATEPRGMAIRTKIPSSTAELALAAVPMSTTHRAQWIDPARYGIAAVGAALVLVYLLLYALRKPVPTRY